MSWDERNGKPFTEDTMEELIELLSLPYIKGLTLSGGDPLYQPNRNTVTEIAKVIKERLPNKDIWLYTGYSWEEVKDLEIMKYIDYIVDGEFHLDKRDTTLAFRGSSNQRVINLAGGVTYGL